MAEVIDQAMPEFSIGILELDDREIMVLEITTAGTRYQTYIATKETYRQVADKLSEGIRRAGAEMKSTILVTNVKELPDGLRNRSKEGR